MSQTDTLERPATASSQSITVDRDQLLSALRAVGAVIEARNTIPILSNYRLTADGGILTVTGTDMDTWSEVRISAHGDMDITASADRLVSAIDTLRPGEVSLSVVQGMMEIKQGRSNRKVPTLSASDFPVQKRPERSTQFEIAARDFAAALAITRVAVSTEETRYFLCGVHLHNLNGQLAFVAMDGIRFIRAVLPLPTGAGSLDGTIIATKGVNLLCSMLGDVKNDDPCRVTVSEKAVEVTYGRATVAAKVVDGTFPDYQRVIPTGNSNRLSVHAAELDRGLRAAGAAAEGKSRGIRLDLSGTHCEASGQAANGGQAVEPMDAEYVGPDMAIGLNFSLAASLVKAFGTTASLEVAIGDDPRAILLITSNDRPGVLAGMMPMRA